MEAYAPKSIDKLILCLGELTPCSKILAGGTDFIIRLNQSNHQSNTVDRLLYLGDIPALKEIQTSKGILKIGAMASMTEIATSPLTPQSLTAIQQAAADMGSSQIRNWATIGGNIAGASPAADLMPLLFLLGAKATVLDAQGSIHIKKIADLIIGSGKTNLAYNEAILNFLIPIPPKGYCIRFRKLGFRSKVSIARITAALALKYDENKVITNARLYLGAISPAPVLCESAEMLIGTTADEQTINALCKELSQLILQVAPGRVYKSRAIYGLMHDFIL